MEIHWTKTSWFSGLIFLLIFAGLFFFYQYNITFSQPPQSIHTWRQTNSLSMTQMYYQYDVPFLQPEIQNQISDDGNSGKTAGEFPVIYFVMAKVWKIFGKSEWLFRMFHLFILFSGLFLLFRMWIPLTGHAIKAGFIPMLVMTSPMIIFYGPNFLPDAPALALIFVAWYFLYSFIQSRKIYLLWISAAFFFLGISLKITVATSFLAIGSWIVLESLFLKTEKRVFNFRRIHYLPFILSLAGVLLWYWYVSYYTGLHKGSFSFMGIWPVWKMTPEQYHKIIDALDKVFFKEFFWPPLQYATAVVWIFLLTRIRKLTPFIRYMLILMPLGTLGILVLWFQVLEGHDYYLITQIQTLIVIWIIFFHYLKQFRFSGSRVFLGVLVVIFAVLATNGRNRHHKRYSGWMNEGYKMHFEALTTIQPLFDQWGIGENDLVISLPDPSINASLYYMNRKGYTDFASDFTREETFSWRISQGAKYLIINDTTILVRPEISKYARHPIGNYKNIRVFNLKPFSEGTPAKE
jgi:hypothetical protein